MWSSMEHSPPHRSCMRQVNSVSEMVEARLKDDLPELLAAAQQRFCFCVSDYGLSGRRRDHVEVSGRGGLRSLEYTPLGNGRRALLSPSTAGRQGGVEPTG